MAKILFASNNISHFPTLVSSSVVGSFDPTKVPYSFALNRADAVNSPVFIPSTGADTWFHFACYPVTINGFASDHWFSAFDAAGHKLFQLLKTLNNSEYKASGTAYNGTTSVNGVGTVGMTPLRMNFVDIHVRVTLVLIEVNVYINNTFSMTMSIGSNPASWGKPVRFMFGAGFINENTNLCHMSELMVADGDTRNARLNLIRPESAGAFTEWEGSLTTLVDENPTSGMTTLEPGMKVTTVNSPYVGPANISNVALISRTTKGLNAPSKIKHLIRAGGVNYESPELAVADVLQYNITSFEINPATSLPWVSADLSAIETGFLSVA